MSAFVWSAQAVTQALGLPRIAWDHAYAGVCTDTRAVQERDLYVALQGERFDVMSVRRWRDKALSQSRP